MRIYKYPLIITDKQTISLPKGSTILSVANQREQLVLYALIQDSTINTEEYKIRIIGTGHNIICNVQAMTFAGTVLMDDGSLVWHIFYEKK